jgi:ribosomal peptide maturation radical SAM protein 1
MSRPIAWQPADLLLILPPFSLVEYPSLALHSLQAAARQAGFRVAVWYAGMDFAARLGPDYQLFCGQNYFLLGERVFARAAWGQRVAAGFPDGLLDYRALYGQTHEPMRLFPPLPHPDLARLRRVEALAADWLAELEGQFEQLPYKYVGVSNSFEQTNAGLALLGRIKARNPGITTLMGGYACEGSGAEGIASLDPAAAVLDHLFSGECEATLVDFLREPRAAPRIIKGTPLRDWEGLPFLDYREYFDQLHAHFPDTRPEDLCLVLESSRGCWWGQQSQCLFCGYDERLGFREKSPERMLAELDDLKRWGVKRINMADLIMPYRHFDRLLPELARRGEGWRIYYEQRPAWDHQKLDLLARAGIREHQPGIESLSDTLLQYMGKGSTLKQNLRFLRDATAAGLRLYWNMLWGFPGEDCADYKTVNELVPLITHLIPPFGIFRIALVKFSPFWRQPEKYGISNLRPAPGYAAVFPAGARTDLLAYLFAGDYAAGTLADRSEIDRLEDQLEAWHRGWQPALARPRLQVARQGDGSLVLVDTRGLDGNATLSPLDPERAAVLLDCGEYRDSPAQVWALRQKAAIRWRDQVISLATIEPELRPELDRTARG